MTSDEIEYFNNARISKVLSSSLEQLIRQADYEKKMLRTDSYYWSTLKIVQIRSRLNELWHTQVDLYFKINKTQLIEL